MQRNLSWVSIARLGLVQACLGAVVVLVTSTLNRIMVVELALPAMLPGALVALHHAMQLLRPRMGHGSDKGRRLTPWIVGGMATLAAGGLTAALATALMSSAFWPGLCLNLLAFTLIGAGVSAAGTSLLVLLAKRVHEDRRGAAATVVWMMMIAGFAITATVTGKLLDPFSLKQLVKVAAGLGAVSFVLSTLAVWGVEGKAVSNDEPFEQKSSFKEALKQVWSEPDARRFTLFVFVSMLAYSAQDLILEPFAGAIFSFSPGESTRLSGVQHGGVFVGMLTVAVLTSIFKGSLRKFVLGGCIASAAAMLGLVVAGITQGPWPLKENVFVLGVANGVFSIAAIGAMMALAGQGRASREGVRMGLWGAAQAIAFAAGGFFGTVVTDAARSAGLSGGRAYAVVFALEAVGFMVAHVLATNVQLQRQVTETTAPSNAETARSAA